MKIEFKWIVLISLFFGGLFYLQVWFGSEWRALQGPDLLAKDQQGNLYIGIHSIILRYGPDGRYLDQRDLMQLGIESHIGGLGFFPNGDILMVPQSYKPSFLQKYLMLYRITDAVSNAVTGSSGRLSRCAWDTLNCAPLTEFTRSFSRAFWIDIDENENIFLADTSQHKIFWLNKDGRELDVLEDREKLQFPNQIKRQNNFLWIANCNDNSLSRVQLEQGKFNRAITRFPVSGAGIPPNDRWPMGVVLLDKDYFVLAQGPNLMKGSIYRLNETGAIKDIFLKDESTNFVALTTLNHEILAADFASLRIWRYNKFGAKDGEFTSPEWENIRKPLNKQILRFKRLERMCKLLFWCSLCLGFAIAIWLERNHKNSKKDEPYVLSIGHINTNFPPMANDKRIQWMEYKAFNKEINKWLIWFWVPALLLVLPGLLSAEEETSYGTSMFLLSHGFLLLVLINRYRLTNKYLGALAPWVLMKSGEKQVTVGREGDLLSYQFFNNAVLMVGSEDMLVRERGNCVFSGKLAGEYVERLIASSHPLTFFERFQWLIEHKFSQFVWQLMLAILYVAISLAIHLR